MHKKHPHLIHLKYRPDIDGLRAIAILAVVIYHSSQNTLKGGFIGVDIFFVISGFLISAIIFSSLEHDRFSIVEFYVRRIKRIFPALILVLFSSLLIGWFVLFADEYKQLGKHTAAGAGFIQNIILWKESGYFDNASETKPLLHLWSLAIEEQFYIFWPLLLFFVWKRRWNFLKITVVTAVVSFSANIYLMHQRPTAAFYLPIPRFWELMIGSVLSYLYMHRPQLIDRYSNAQSALGAILISVGLLMINKDSDFPGWWSLAPTLGTFFIISAGPNAWLNHKVLANKVIVWIGLISYPLYLWHWPLLSFARIMESETPTLEIRVAAVTISIVLAWLTYEFIEKPSRLGKHGKTKAVTFIVLMIIAGGAGYGCYMPGGFKFRLTGKLSHEEALNNLKLESRHSRDKVCATYYPGYIYCKISDSGIPTVALIGDSFADAYFAGLSEEFRKHNDNLVLLGVPGCPPLLDISSGYSGKDDWCGHKYKNTSDALKEIASNKHIHTIILAANWHLYINGTRFSNNSKVLPKWEIRSPEINGVSDNAEVFVNQMGKTIDLLRQNGKRIIVIKQTPELNYSPIDCISGRPVTITAHHKLACIQPSSVQKQYLQEYETYFDKVLKNATDLTVIDPFPYFCDKEKCISTLHGNSLYRDELHLSLFGSRYLAENLFPIK